MINIPRRVRIGNRVLAPLNLELSERRPSAWDRAFKQWIERAKERGIDPNDLGDDAWSGDRLEDGLRDHYLPLISSKSTVLELGPGSGRLTRHVIAICSHVSVADASPTVCGWLNEYLSGKGSFTVIEMDDMSLPSVATNSIDVTLAHGVVEHLDPEVFAMLLMEVKRVLVPGGRFAFSFDNLCSTAAAGIFSDLAGRTPAHRFRLYHPAAIERLGEMYGFVATTCWSEERVGFALLTLCS